MSQMFNPPHPGEVLRDYLPETIVGSLTQRLTQGNRQQYSSMQLQIRRQPPLRHWNTPALAFGIVLDLVAVDFAHRKILRLRM